MLYHSLTAERSRQVPLQYRPFDIKIHFDHFQSGTSMAWKCTGFIWGIWYPVISKISKSYEYCKLKDGTFLFNFWRMAVLHGVESLWFQFLIQWKLIIKYGHHGEIPKSLYYPGVRIKWAIRKKQQETCFIDTKTTADIFTATLDINSLTACNCNKFEIKKPHAHLS